MLNFREWLYLFEQAGSGYAYVGNAIIIPSAHGAKPGTTQIKPPPDRAARQYASSICKKFGYWYEGKGEEGRFGKGPERKYCEKVLGVHNPKNNGSYDDSIVMTGFYAGVPTFSSVEANWSQNSQKIDFQNSITVGDALKSALANGAGTFAKGNENIKLGEGDIQKIFDVVRQVFPDFETQQFKTADKASEFKAWLLQAEDLMWEQKGNALSALGDAAEKEREVQIVSFANTKGGILFLGAGHFPRLQGVSWSPPQGAGGNQQQAPVAPQQAAQQMTSPGAPAQA